MVRKQSEFRQLVREAYGNGTDVRLLIPPSHAWHWQTLWLSGLWPRFEEMKRQLVKINESEALRAGCGPSPIRDFSGTNGPTLEQSLTTQTGTIRWFWEPVQYKRTLGDFLLSRVMGTAGHDAPEIVEFGVLLDGSGLESPLAKLRALQQAYATNHPADVARIKASINQAGNHGHQ